MERTQDDSSGRPTSGDAWATTLPVMTPPLVQLRRWLTTSLAHLPDEFLQDLMIICTELVSNSYDHARGPRDLRIFLSETAMFVRLEVDDASPTDHPVLGSSRLAHTRGRGLVLVDKLTTRWGVHVELDRKTVWAELAVPAAKPSMEAAPHEQRFASATYLRRQH